MNDDKIKCDVSAFKAYANTVNCVSDYTTTGEFKTACGVAANAAAFIGVNGDASCIGNGLVVDSSYPHNVYYKTTNDLTYIGSCFDNSTYSVSYSGEDHTGFRYKPREIHAKIA